MSFEIGLLVVLLVVLVSLHSRRKRKAQLAFIESYPFNPAIGQKVKAKYPHLSDENVALVMDALREYFYFCHQAKRRVVSMPSQVVDVAWHEFILFTRDYQQYCKKALGRFLHHTPTEAMSSPTKAQIGIKRAWRLACAKEGINPKTPAQLPLIFALDAQLGIDDGFKYSLNCKDKSSPLYGDSYCAGHIGCSSGCAGDSGGSSDSFGGDSSGCSSGCGGGD
ncbi:glycine-rich domain-containing protein [Litoribrevibacter euphylliae]|uniref:Glycine-rich domain-containing protein n=1 Tax=Litoribrevibacter euphylliae TaxID=1834034 RepID=A0ABV7HLX0_9GAMM